MQTKLCVIITVILLAAPVSAKPPPVSSHPRGDGRLVLYSYHTDDVLEIAFRTHEGYDQRALEKINMVMRSHGDDAIYPIAPRLLDLIDHIQDHFGAETVEIISGYRSRPFNDSLRATGRGAAGESLHMEGMAADIHLDEITEEALWNYAKTLGAGGAGFYPRHNFVHVDVGPRRSWQEAPPKERILTGVDLNPNTAWDIRTEKNIYGPGEAVAFTVTNATNRPASLVMNIRYDHFRKGRWLEGKHIEKSRITVELEPGMQHHHRIATTDFVYGKHRIVVFVSRDREDPPAYSNEFYIKKQ